MLELNKQKLQYGVFVNAHAQHKNLSIVVYFGVNVSVRRSSVLFLLNKYGMNHVWSNPVDRSCLVKSSGG